MTFFRYPGGWINLDRVVKVTDGVYRPPGQGKADILRRGGDIP